MRFLIPFILALPLASCGPSEPEGPVSVAVIDEFKESQADQFYLSAADGHLRAATAEGLVALDASGNVIPALAERWIVTEDGLSYIFRLRNSDWPSGEPFTADDVRTALLGNLRGLRGTALGLDLSKVDVVRDMTGRVIEITLTSPMPDFLRLLAQPEMGILLDDIGAGPMAQLDEPAADLDNDEVDAEIIVPYLLDPMPPEARGYPAREEWRARSRQVISTALPAQAAVDAFASGEADLVLNGTLANLPLANTGPLTRGTIRLDATLGLFGLIIRSDAGFLGDPLNRQALGLALDRDALLQSFNIDGWQSSSWIIPTELAEGEAAAGERWANLSLEERRDIATRRVAVWERLEEEEVVLRIGLPAGPGSDLLFRQLSRDFGQIGITAVQADLGEGAELELHDRLARFYSPRWFLNQFHCRLQIGLCSEEADDLVEQSIVESDAILKAQLLAAAHGQLIESEVFIPFGVPVRWSLVRGDVTGFEENRWGLHPLFMLSQPPN